MHWCRWCKLMLYCQTKKKHNACAAAGQTWGLSCRWSPYIHLVSLLWLMFAAVTFTLPQEYPITGNNFNAAPAAIIALLILTSAAWVLSARFWFTGPRIDVDNSDAVKAKYWITDHPRRDLAAACVRSAWETARSACIQIDHVMAMKLEVSKINTNVWSNMQPNLHKSQTRSAYSTERSTERE